MNYRLKHHPYSRILNPIPITIVHLMYECLLNGTKLQKWSNSIQTKGMFCGGRSIFNDQMGVAAPLWTLRHSCAKNHTLFPQNSIILAASNSKFPNNNSAHSRLTSAALVFPTTTPLNYSFCVGLVWFRCVPTSLHFYSLAIQQEISFLRASSDFSLLQFYSKQSAAVVCWYLWSLIP